MGRNHVEFDQDDRYRQRLGRCHRFVWLLALSGNLSQCPSIFVEPFLGRMPTFVRLCLLCAGRMGLYFLYGVLLVEYYFGDCGSFV